MYLCMILKLRMASLRQLIDNNEIELTDEVKQQVLNKLLPIATNDDSFYVNGDMKDRAQ